MDRVPGSTHGGDWLGVREEKRRRKREREEREEIVWNSGLFANFKKTLSGSIICMLVISTVSIIVFRVTVVFNRVQRGLPNTGKPFW